MSLMPERPTYTLTTRQQQVLALVANGFQSGEIATRLGISEDTVNKHAEAATRVIGANGRRQAARLWRESLEVPPPEPVLPDPIGLPTDAQTRLVDPVGTGGGESEPLAPVEVRDSGVISFTPIKPARRLGLPIRRKGERFNDLSPTLSLIWVPIITLLIVFSVKLLISEMQDLKGSRLPGAPGNKPTPNQH